MVWRSLDSPRGPSNPAAMPAGDAEPLAIVRTRGSDGATHAPAVRQSPTTTGLLPAPVIQTPQRFLDKMRFAQEKRVALAYVDLERELGLTTGQADAVRALEVDHFMRTLGLDPVQAIEDAAAERDSARRLHDDIGTLLGARDAARFAGFEQTIDARSRVADLQAQLAEARLPLSEEQRRAWIQAAIRDGAYLAAELHTGAESYDAHAQEILARAELRDAKLLASARGVLDSRQLEKLREMVDELRADHQRWTR